MNGCSRCGRRDISLGHVSDCATDAIRYFKRKIYLNGIGTKLKCEAEVLDVESHVGKINGIECDGSHTCLGRT